MNIVFEIITPVLGLVLIGYCASVMRWFSDQHAEGLTRFVFDFAVPVMLFRTLARAESLEQLPFDLIGAYYIPVFIFYVFGMLVARFLFKRTFDGQIITGFSFCYGNVLQIGLPLTLLTFGEQRSISYFILMSFHALTTFTLTTILFEIGRSKGDGIGVVLRKSITGILTNPIIIGIVAGFICNRLGWKLSGPVDAVASYLQQAVLPCALFSLGAALSKYRLAGRIGQTMVVLVAKLILFPLTVWFSCRMVFGLDLVTTAIATLMAASPVGINVYLFADRYRAGQALATTSVLLTTVASVLSLSLIIYLIDSAAIR